MACEAFIHKEVAIGEDLIYALRPGLPAVRLREPPRLAKSFPRTWDVSAD